MSIGHNFIDRTKKETTNGDKGIDFGTLLTGTSGSHLEYVSFIKYSDPEHYWRFFSFAP